MDEIRGTSPVIIGGVLFDRFPDGQVVPGGAPIENEPDLRVKTLLRDYALQVCTERDLV